MLATLAAILALAVPTPAHVAGGPPRPHWVENCTGDLLNPAAAKCRFVVKPSWAEIRAYLRWQESHGASKVRLFRVAAKDHKIPADR